MIWRMGTSYPKRYCRVVRVYRDGSAHPVAIGVVPLDGKRIDESEPARVLERGEREIELRLAWRSGWGHCGCRGFDFGEGTVVKVYRRPGKDRSHLAFRRVGS
jgi:hypothetical protein